MEAQNLPPLRRSSEARERSRASRGSAGAAPRL